MQLSLFIAKRYLFSRKKQNAINIISIISVVGVAIGTSALIVILSIFNGIDLLLQQSTDSFTPDLTISPASGKFTSFDDSLYNYLRQNKEIAFFNNIVEEKAMVKYDEKLSPVIVKGVDSNYIGHTSFEKNILQGEVALKTGNNYKAIVGYGLAAELGIGLNFLTPLIFYYPNRNASSDLTALHSEYLYPSAFFSAQQEIDGAYILTDIQFAQQLFHIGNRISKIEVKLARPGQLKSIKQQLKNLAGTNYKIEDKYEINRSFYAMMKSEKLAVFLILLFILLIASFNIVGSISMLILDKKEDLSIYRALGMSRKKIISIFKTEGNMITFSGAMIGLIIGTVICLLQEKFGFITLGDGNYIISAYPVKLVVSDVAFILLTVLSIGYIASFFPVKYLVNKLTES